MYATTSYVLRTFVQLSTTAAQCAPFKVHCCKGPIQSVTSVIESLVKTKSYLLFCYLDCFNRLGKPVRSRRQENKSKLDYNCRVPTTYPQITNSRRRYTLQSLTSFKMVDKTPSPQPDLDRNRLPTLFEVLSRRTLPPVDLFSFYIYMRDQQKSVDYLDFWYVLDLGVPSWLCFALSVRFT